MTPRGGVKILNLLLGMSYNMPKVLCSKFQSHKIQIEDICLREGQRNRGKDTRKLLSLARCGIALDLKEKNIVCDRFG